MVRKILLLISILFSAIIYGQCYDADFESGTLAGWQGRRGDCCPINLTVNGIVNGRQTVVGPGIDPNTCGGLSTVYAGNFSARLGNNGIGAQSESLSYTFTVLPGGSLVQYAYAVVFQDPSHTVDEQPRFSSRVILQDGSVIPCTDYYVSADLNDPTFQLCPSNPVTIVWKDWSLVTVDLTAYIGQTVTLEFQTGDCALGGHFGYAYLDAIYCISNEISIDYCEGDTLATLSAPSGFESYLWDNGDTTATITIDPNLWTNISCQLTTVTGCVLVINSLIYPTTVSSDFTYSGQCEGIFDFEDISTSSDLITSYLWDFGDGTTSTDQNPSHYFGFGDWIVTLTVTTSIGCVSTSSHQITSNPIPISLFNTQDVCLGSISNFTPISTPMGYQFDYMWSLGDGTISNLESLSHTYLTSGTYQVSLITTTQNTNCSDTTYGTINVREYPMAEFTLLNNCDGNVSQFTNTSTLPNWSSNQYLWNFGDGNISSLFDPTHLYSSYGEYQVDLLVSSSDGITTCESSYTLPIVINPNPNPSFTSFDVCVNDSINFTNNSQIALGQISSNWNFGDGQVSMDQSPSHLYQQAGIYSVTLTTTSDSGCVSSYTDTININQLPNIEVTSDIICIGQYGTLFAQGADSYVWYPSINLQNPTSQQTTANPTATTIYNVIGTDLNGCSDTAQATIIVNNNPVIITNDVSVCEGGSVELNVYGASTYIWIPSAGLNSTIGNSVISTPDISTTYTVIGTDLNGCHGVGIVGVTVIENPIVSVTSGYVCHGESIQINASGASTYIWSPSIFLNSPSGSQVTSTPDSTITYTVIGISQENCKDTVESIIVVYPESEVSFTLSDYDGCSPLEVQFTDSSTQNISMWRWDFGDGTSSSIQNPTHTYTNVGSYVITLNVTTNNNCLYYGSSDGSVVVYPDPTSDFQVTSPNVSEESPIIGLQNNSIGGVFYVWDFGDGSYASTTHTPPPHFYGDVGEYQISLEVTNKFGCLDISYQTITIDPLYTFYIPNAFTPNGDGINDIFFGRGSGYKKVNMRIFDRWGELIFDATSLLGPNIIGPYWDGRLRGSECQIDVYNYQFFVTDVFDIVHKYIGSVTLVR